MIYVAALGELLIDFTPAGISENGHFLFEQNPGGAPANVLALLSRLGKRTVFIGKVGEDAFGRSLRKELADMGINTAGLADTNEAITTLAFVHLQENGEREFSFCRKPGADMMLTENDLPVNLLQESTFFHFCSLTLSNEPSRSATLKAAHIAKKNGSIISFDPNLRLPVWESPALAKEMILEAIAYADILKVSEEELVFVTGTADLWEGTRQLAVQFDTPVIFVTLGEKGSFFRKREATGFSPPFLVDCVDTTGAGDAFVGAVIYQMLERKLRPEACTIVELDQIALFANAAGALAATKRGGIQAMPTLNQINEMHSTLHG